MCKDPETREPKQITVSADLLRTAENVIPVPHSRPANHVEELLGKTILQTVAKPTVAAPFHIRQANITLRPKIVTQEPIRKVPGNARKDIIPVGRSIGEIQIITTSRDHILHGPVQAILNPLDIGGVLQSNLGIWHRHILGQNQIILKEIHVRHAFTKSFSYRPGHNAPPRREYRNAGENQTPDTREAALPRAIRTGKTAGVKGGDSKRRKTGIRSC